MMSVTLKHGILLLVAGVIAAMSSAYWQSVLKARKADWVSFMASDAHVVIGEVPLKLPYVALRDYTHLNLNFSFGRVRDDERARRHIEETLKGSNAPITAPNVEQLAVLVYHYGWNNYEWEACEKICSQFTSQWARKICNDPWARLKQALPNGEMSFVDERALDAFTGSWIRGERVGEQLLEMDRNYGRLSVHCDQKDDASVNKFCSAVYRVEKNLLAVWTVWNSNSETAQEMAIREGAAIDAFVAHAVGGEEHFELLMQAVCPLRRPDSVDGVGGPSPDCM